MRFYLKFSNLANIQWKHVGPFDHKINILLLTDDIKMTYLSLLYCITKCIICSSTLTSSTMVKIKYLICWNTARITTPRIRLNQLSLPNRFTLNIMGECIQVRMFFYFIQSSFPHQKLINKKIQPVK